MEDYAVFDEEHTVGVAGCLGGVCDHQDCLTVEVPVYLLQIIIVPGSLMGVVRQIQDIIRYTFYIKNAEHDSKTK